MDKVTKMIVLHNNYIFLPKINKKASFTSSKDTDGTIHLKMEKKFFHI